MNSPEAIVVSVARNGEQVGDFPWGSIRQLMAAGSILPTDHYWHQGMSEWRLVSDTWTPALASDESTPGTISAGLRACPSCRREVSPAAVACPHCGHAFEKGFMGRQGFERTLNLGCLGIILFVLLIALFFGSSGIVQLFSGGR
jgi:hypothetical protein